jgi:ABC-type uncharacterized transport system auxiliary subunit
VNARRVCGALLALLALAGCGTLSAPPKDTYYRLALEVPEAKVDDPAAPVVFVPPFAASGLHGERALVHAAADGTTLQQSAYHYWSDSPRVMLQQALADRLRASVARTVLLEPSAAATHVVTGRIRQFERAQADGGAVARVTLELAVERNGESLPELERTYTRAVPLADGAPGAFPPAASEATRAIMDDFIRDLTAHWAAAGSDVGR